MAVILLPVDQRVINIDSRRFASIEKAMVELITNSDDSYLRMENRGSTINGDILIIYERHQNGAVVSIADQAEGMEFSRLCSILSYGGAYSSMARGESGGRGYFGRGLKQAVYGLGHGWVESIKDGKLSRVDLFRSENGEYKYDDWDGDRTAAEKDYERLNIPVGGNGTKVTIIVENHNVIIPYFKSLAASITHNFYLRDILRRRTVKLLNATAKTEPPLLLRYIEPEAEILLGPETQNTFVYKNKVYPYFLTLKRAVNATLTLKGDERTNGLLVTSDMAVFDCGFFNFENRLGTEYLFGTISCPSLAQMLANGLSIISDERDGLNLKEPFITAFADSVSNMIAGIVNSERLRLSHIERASTSRRTQGLLESVLQRMNRAAVEEVGLFIPPTLYDDFKWPILRFSTPFYYRKVNHQFHVTLIADTRKLVQDLTFTYDLPASIAVIPRLDKMPIAALPADGRFAWTMAGTEIGAKGRIEVSSGDFAAFSEIVIAQNASGKGYHSFSGQPNPAKVKSADLFVGYELRSLDNDIDRAVYNPEERLILINTAAPTVRLYVNGQGHFKDGARLLLAELFLDVIAGELARRYLETNPGWTSGQYNKAKQTFIKRYGVEIHSILLGD